MRQIATIPNGITLLRILMLPVVIPIIIRNSYQNSILIIGFLVSYLALDALDGFLARKLHQVTRLGHILDPLADKLALATLSLILSLYKGMPRWPFYIILTRELLILFGSTMLIRKRDFIPKPNAMGKASTFFLGLSFLGYLLLPHSNIYPFTALIIGMTLYIFSFIFYLLIYMRVMEHLQKATGKIAKYF